MAKDEIVTIVSEDDIVVGSAPRSQMRVQGLPHRSTYVLVFNAHAELFVQKRTLSKDVFPGYYDVAAGGVVLANESYDMGAHRELREELGIENADLRRFFKFYYRKGRVWGMAYACMYSGEMQLQEEEIESGRFWKIREILDRRNEIDFTPDGIYVLNRCLSDEKLLDGLGISHSIMGNEKSGKGQG